MTANDRDLRSAHGRSRCGSKSQRACGAAARFCGYVEIYRGIYVNPHVPRRWFAQSSPPDKFTSKSRSYHRNSDGEKDRELRKQRRDFSLCKALRRYGCIGECSCSKHNSLATVKEARFFFCSIELPNVQECTETN